MSSQPPLTQASGTALSLIDNRYRDNQDGTITDTQTKLQWKRCSEGQRWTGTTCSGEPEKYSWVAAMEVTSDFSDKSDWRLPTIKELNTLVFCRSGKQRQFKEDGYDTTSHKGGRDGCDDKELYDIDTKAFPNSVLLHYYNFWSASVYAGDAIHRVNESAWLVNFSAGHDVWSSKSNSYPVRLVRGQ